MKASDRTTAELKALENLPDARIDTSDIPEKLEWIGAVRARFHTKSEPVVKPDLANPTSRSKWLRRLQARTRSNAEKREIKFDLRPGYAEVLYNQQHGRCAVSGIKFNLDRFENALVKHPYAPSIDRKLSEGDYIEDNVRLVCVGANFAMGEWGEEVFLTLARGAVRRAEQIASAGPDTDADSNWEAALRERIIAAEELLSLLPSELQRSQRKHIAGLKAALSKGLARSRTAAMKAAKTRRRGHRSV